ncbi:DUF3300 domain-containing protein [Geminisphaera colitermitum]|uniref:DUF3300 domain-containing protein n=1 Tax=Geminisphaera colitermitum TaxID=1148786 RepID=UPI000158D180|nr:DUF3300 domain-containing protein [Geminisphaera colitermitum]
MKNLFYLLLSFSLTAWAPVAWADENVSGGGERGDEAPEVLLSDEELDKLTGPIALYPDALVALILPASTEAADVVLAARFFANGGKSADVGVQPWDESVRALARYPEVIQWMDENLAWTRQLGVAFLAQPSGVMQAIQRMRARAQEAGNLTSTQEQTVIVEPDYIRIVPTQPEVIYVPRYNPEIVYVPVSTYYGPVIAYGAPYPCGSWLRYDCNWLSWSIWVGSWSYVYYRQPAWRPPPGYHPPRGGPPSHHGNTWRPPPGKRPPAHVYPPRYDGRRDERRAERPVPMHGAPGRASYFVRPGDGGTGPRAGRWERPGSDGRLENQGNFNSGNRGDNRRPDGTLRPAPRPRLGEDGNRLAPGISNPNTPAARPSPPVAAPDAVGRGGSGGPAAADRTDRRERTRVESTGRPEGSWRREWGDGQPVRRNENRITPVPGVSPAPSLAPAPGVRGERESREASSDVRRRTFLSGGDGAAPPSQGVRPGRSDAYTGAREVRSRRDSPSSLSSPASPAQRPSAPPPRRQAPPPPPPSPPPSSPSITDDQKQADSSARASGSSRDGRERSRR